MLFREGRQWCFRLAEEVQVSVALRLWPALEASAWIRSYRAGVGGIPNTLNERISNNRVETSPRTV